MKTIKRMIEQYKQNKNIIPIKTIVLSTGIVCEHYKNGNIKIK
jgi:hypothetical protein